MTGSLSALAWRQEIKFLIRNENIATALDTFNSFLCQDRHAKDGYYDVNSIYFDTADNRLFKSKMAGDLVRLKLRTRWYGDAPEGNCVRELKWRKGRMNAKDKVWGPFEALNADVEAGDLTSHPTGVRASLYGSFAPRMLIQYRRHPFSTLDGLMRITVDSAIRGTSLDANGASLGASRSLLKDAAIIEVKWGQTLSTSVLSLIHTLPTTRLSFSKYVEAMLLGHQRGYDAALDGVFSL